jgi:hypothetical protein
MDGFHHVVEDWIEELARFLRIPISEQLHRALQIGEEDGDLLALALQGGLRGEDLLGEVLRGVCVTGGELALGRLRSAEPSATSSTELVAWLVGEAA